MLDNWIAFTEMNVRDAAKRWDQEPGVRGFRNGTRYEVFIDGKSYPPKAIASLANEFAGNGILFPRDFVGAREGKWHKLLEAAGYKPTSLGNRSRISLPSRKSQRISNRMSVLDDKMTFPEGRQRIEFNRHVKRERRPEVIRAAKNMRLKRDGCLKCEACSFDFSLIYGERGEGFIEGHHTLPIHQMGPRGRNVSPTEIALVCANCHRMLHRMRPLPSIDELRQLVIRMQANAEQM